MTNNTLTKKKQSKKTASKISSSAEKTVTQPPDEGPDARLDLMNRTVTWLHLNQARIGIAIGCFTLLITAAGVWATFNQIRESGANFRIQMSEQRRATSVLIVSDFMNQVGALSVGAGSADEKKFDQMLVSRSQLLLNTLNDSDLKAQIVQYLASGGFNRVFTTTPFEQKPTLNLKGVSLDGGEFSRVNFTQALFNCTSLAGSTFEYAHFAETYIVRSNFSNSSFTADSSSGSDSIFDGATIQWSTFNGSLLTSGMAPWNATILLSDFRKLKFSEDYLTSLLLAVDADGKAIDNGPSVTSFDLVNQKILDDRNAYEVASILKSSPSLFGTLLDTEVELWLQKLLSDSEYTDVRLQVPDNLKSRYTVPLDNGREWSFSAINKGFCGDV